MDLIWDGPTNPEPAKQNEIIEAWITRGVDVIAVAVENRAGISSVLRKARQKGIKVVTWDADAEIDARDFLINQATPQGIGQTLMDNAARVIPNIDLCGDAYDTAAGCDAVIVVTEWNEFKNIDLERLKSLMHQPLIIDGRNLYAPEVMARYGFTYHSVGRPAAAPERNLP